MPAVIRLLSLRSHERALLVVEVQEMHLPDAKWQRADKRQLIVKDQELEVARSCQVYLKAPSASNVKGRIARNAIHGSELSR